MRETFPYAVGARLRYTGSIFKNREDPKLQEVEVLAVKRRRLSQGLVTMATVRWARGGQRFDLGPSEWPTLSLWEA